VEIIPVTEAEIKITITSLKSKNSTGYDGISNRILKHCVKSISKPLTHIFNNSLFTGIFPEICNSATHLQKRKFKRLEQHLESNHILAAEQFGFRKGISIENAIFTLTNNVITELNQRHK